MPTTNIYISTFALNNKKVLLFLLLSFKTNNLQYLFFIIQIITNLYKKGNHAKQLKKVPVESEIY